MSIGEWSFNSWSPRLAALVLAGLAGAAVTLQHGWVVLVVLFLVALAACARRRPDLVLAIGVIALLLPRGDSGLLSLQVGWLVLEAVMIFALLLDPRASFFDPRLLLSGATLVTITGFGAIQTATGLDGLDPTFSFVAICTQVGLIVMGTVRTTVPADLKTVLSAMMFAGVALSGWAILEYLEMIEAPALGDALGRSVGPIGNPNYFGALLAMLGAACLAGGLFRLAPRIPAFGAAVACAGACVTTQSRGALIAGALAYGFVLAKRFIPSRRVLVGAITVVMLVALASAGFVVLSRARIETSRPVFFTYTEAATFESAALQVRLEAAQLGIELAIDHPLSGVGLDAFPVYASRSHSVAIPINTHNEPIRVAAELGIVGLAALIWFASSVLRRVVLQPHPVPIVIGAALIAYLTFSLFLNGLGDPSLTFPLVALLFIGVGRVVPSTSRASVNE
ncbi:MAG: O-antigen ligase family protein [Actinomycetota bacterium]